MRQGAPGGALSGHVHHPQANRTLAPKPQPKQRILRCQPSPHGWQVPSVAPSGGYAGCLRCTPIPPRGLGVYPCCLVGRSSSCGPRGGAGME